MNKLQSKIDPSILGCKFSKLVCNFAIFAIFSNLVCNFSIFFCVFCLNQKITFLCPEIRPVEVGIEFFVKHFGSIFALT